MSCLVILIILSIAGGADFNTLSVTLTFFSDGPASQSDSVTVEIINDGICEDDENFRLLLSTSANIRPGEDALVIISDDDSKY